MANFAQAIPFILAHEGGYAETPAGEVVNRGINTQTLLALGFKGTPEELKLIVRNLTLVETEEIYQKFYWTFKVPSIPNALDQVTSQAVGGKILDMMVLSGQGTAIKLVQRSAGVLDDGYFGPGTLEAVQSAGDGLITALISNWTEALTTIINQRILQAMAQENTALESYWESVKVGWLARASWNGQ